LVQPECERLGEEMGLMLHPEGVCVGVGSWACVATASSSCQRDGLEAHELLSYAVVVLAAGLLGRVEAPAAQFDQLGDRVKGEVRR
jgi:hypothetical protein